MKRVYASLVRLIFWFTWPLAGLVLHNSNRVRVYVVADGKVLLQKTSYSSQSWSLPGGGVEKNESAAMASQRELKEETGLELGLDKFLELGVSRVPVNGRSWPVMNVTFFLVELSDLQPTNIPRPLEIIGLKWFDLDSLPSNLSDTVKIAQKLLTNTQ